MFPNRKPCLCKETNDSYSKAVARILVITILLAVGLSVLGAWVVAQNDFQDKNFESSFIPENKISEDSSSDIISEATHFGFSDVPVPEKGCFGPYDTIPGDMAIIKQKLPTGDLPLCIDNTYLDGNYIFVGVYGGYQWYDGCIDVIQAKSDDCFWADNVVGSIDIIATPVTDYPGALCGWTYYNLTFTVGESPIVLDSNHPPASPLGDFCVFFPHDDLDKFVHLKVNTEWTGCGLPEQHFMVILAHKTMSQNKIPDSR